MQVSSASRLAVSLFAWFLGVFGAHRFYLGKPGTAVLMLLTGGGVGIWWLVDAITALCGCMRDKDGKLIRNWDPSVEHTEPPKTANLPQIVGILSIVAGAVGFVGGIMAVTILPTLVAGQVFSLGMAGIPAIVFGIVAVVGGIYTLQKKNWSMALVGAIFALFSSWFFGGVLALVFTVISRKDFEPPAVSKT